MSATDPSPWRWPSSSHILKAKEPYLQRTVSVTDLHDDLSWCWKSSPPSPTQSVISASSRSATPANPWRSHPSSPISSFKSPSAIWSDADDLGRCTTPIASLKRPSPGTRSGSGSLSPSTREGPSSPVQAPMYSPEQEVKDALKGDILITPSVVSQLRLLFPSLLSRQGWERSTSQRAYGWALQNPKVACLLLACEDLASWRRAVIYGLEDAMLPFKEFDLDGVASDPTRAILQQWRVLAKPLPTDGQITEFGPKELLPLSSLGSLSQGSNSSVDRVQWRDTEKPTVYVRKTIRCTQQAEKEAAVSSINDLRRLKHLSILPICCAYTQGLAISAITPTMTYSLETFLNDTSTAVTQDLLLGWINNLTQALAHIHSKDVLHRSIRPSKILIDMNNRIFFGFFGLSISALSAQHQAIQSSSSATFTSLPQKQYVYAAPEVAYRQRHSRASDIFSLGCVFLDMLTAATQPELLVPIKQFATFRSAGTDAGSDDPIISSRNSSTASGGSEASFHEHLDRVQAWMKQLRASIPSTQTKSLAAGGAGNSVYIHQALAFVTAMLTPEPTRRPRSRGLANHVERWDEVRRSHGGGRRKSEG